MNFILYEHLRTNSCLRTICNANFFPYEFSHMNHLHTNFIRYELFTLRLLPLRTFYHTNFIACELLHTNICLRTFSHTNLVFTNFCPVTKRNIRRNDERSVTMIKQTVMEMNVMDNAENIVTIDKLVSNFVL